MNESNSILKDIRVAVGLTEDTVDFDTDLIMHINAALGELYQNGVGFPIVLTDDTTTWDELKDPLQAEGNLYFHMIPLYITMSTKIIFDPPPPSTVEVYKGKLTELLWRLKIAYEDMTTTTTTTVPY